MKTKLYAVKLVLLFWCLVPLIAFSQQIPKSVVGSNGVFIGFYEYKPVTYTAEPTRKYPLIIFLHGIGERGNGTTELPRVLANAIPKYINAGHTMTFTYNGQQETFLVISPQLSQNYGSWQNFYVDEMIKYAKTNLRVDTNRIYLTGLSLGGGGTWKYASGSYNNARQLAAIAPVCGTCDWGNMCTSIAAAQLPVWAFHAQDDGVVGYGCTTGAVSMINSCSPAVAPIMTIYPNGNHWIWDRSYDTTHTWHNPNVYEWFLSKTRATGTPPPPTNIPPVARAGSDQTITLPTSAVTLNGSASSDANGSITSYAWVKISGPSAGTITAASNAITDVTGLVQGVYGFQLTVTDNQGATGRDTVMVTVNGAVPTPNSPPVSVAGADVSITLPNNNTYLFGSGSYDSDGFINGYAWSQVSGPSTATIVTTSASNINATNLVQGVYKFRLLVTDNLGATDDDTVSVTVSAPNLPPTANAGADQNIQLPANSVTLNGTGSTDADGTIGSYAWTKISGPAQFNISNAAAASTSVTNLAQGTYAFRLVVTDNVGASDDDTVFVTVSSAPPPPNVPPVANAGADQNIQLPANSITLDGTGSTDSDGTISTYAWTKISGPAQYTISNAAGASTSVTNLVQGTYTFRLLVTDNSGATDDDDVVITVAAAPPPPNIPPVANAGADQYIQLPSNSVTLNGSGSTDADGSITSYAWTKISGPAQYNISNASGSTTSVTNLVQGTYAFRLVVTDNSGATDDDTVTVTVSSAPPPPNVPPVANAGADQSIQLPTNSVTLDGSGSTDSDGIISSYAWTKISGPAQHNISNASAPSTSVTNLAQGTYMFRIVVTDNSGATDDDTVTITVAVAPPPPNVAPVARAGNDTTLVLPSSSATLNGAASYDPDGSIASYKWNRVSGPAGITIVNSTSVQADIVGMAAGEYVFELTVTDNAGATATDQVKITVMAAVNLAPLANAGNDTTVTLPSTTAWLRGHLSRDPDGTITRYQWRQLRGPNTSRIEYLNANSTRVNSLQVGEYQFELTVTDNKGAVATDSVNVSVVNFFRYEEQFLIYPNPVVARATVRVISDSNGDLELRVIDMEGRLVKTITFVKSQAYFEQPIMLSDIRPGIYYIEAVIGTDKKMVKKFIKR